MSSSTSRRLARFAASCLLLAIASPALAVPRDKAGGEREESWQIEQRQQWFEHTRGLRRTPDAQRLRAEAVLALQRQRRIVQARHVAGGEVWQELGPSSMEMGEWAMGLVAGRLNAITPHPTDDRTVYVGAAAGGVWKTTDGGLRWTPLFDDVGTLPIGAITLDPADPDVVWVGTGDKNGGGCGASYFGQGIYLSEDGGHTWAARNGSGAGRMPLSVVNAVAVQPGNGDVILAGGAGGCDANGNLTNPGVFRSTDRGLTWNQVLGGEVEDFVFVPGSTTVYTGLIGFGVYKSVDGGATWTNAGTGLSIIGPRMRLAMAPSDSRVLYAYGGNRLFRSTDGGTTWERRNSSACEGQCTYNQTLAVHPTDPDTVLVGSIRVARSTDGGATLAPLTNEWGTSQLVHQDTHVVRYSLNDPQRFWIGSDGGIWRTDNGGISFADMNSNLNITQFYDIAVHPQDPNVLLGGAQDNSSSMRRTSLVWKLGFGSGDGFMNAFDETDPSIQFQTSYPYNGYPTIARSVAGSDFSVMPTTGMNRTSRFPWVTPLATAGNFLFAASDVLYRTTTLGNAWTPVSPNVGSSASVVTPLRQGSMTPTWIGTEGGRLYRSADAGVPAPVFDDVTGDYPGGRVSDIAIDPLDPQRVFATRQTFGTAHLYRTTSGGTTWTAVGNGLPVVPANSVAIDPLDTGRVFVGTDIGVYESTDGGDNFAAFSSGLPLGVIVNDLEISAAPHVLTAGTYSRGAWRVVLAGGASNMPPTADFETRVADRVASFTDRSIDSDGTLVAHSWDFGDGSPPSTAASPDHAYANYGRYTVALTVTDDGGLSGTYAKLVRVPSPPAPLVNGVTLTGQHAPQDEELRYSLAVPAGATNLRFSTIGVAGEDADLTVTLDGNFVCLSAGASADESCGVADPAPGTYVAVVYAYSALSQFSITGRFDEPDGIFADGFD